MLFFFCFLSNCDFNQVQKLIQGFYLSSLLRLKCIDLEKVKFDIISFTSKLCCWIIENWKNIKNKFLIKILLEFLRVTECKTSKAMIYTRELIIRMAYICWVEQT